MGGLICGWVGDALLTWRACSVSSGERRAFWREVVCLSFFFLLRPWEWWWERLGRGMEGEKCTVVEEEEEEGGGGCLTYTQKWVGGG